MEHTNHDEEIISLNAEDLDVEELENRLELASAIPESCWGFACGSNTSATA